MTSPNRSGNPNDIAFFAETNFLNERKRFGIRLADRRSHIFVVGKTGTGKSTLFESLIRHDITSGHGLALIDPHGDLVERVLAQLPDTRRNDLIYFDVSNTTEALAFNPLQSVPPAKRPLAASGM